jgi:dihydroorotate dehydrogenase
VRHGTGRRLVGAPVREQGRRAVARLRQRWGAGLTIIGSGGVIQPGDALALLAAGADLVQVHSGLVYAGPGLPKRINEALVRALPPVPHAPEIGLRRFGALGFILLGLGMIIGGFLAWLIAATRVVLPYDEAFVGLTRDQLAAGNARLLAFMAHDRVTLAGTMLSIGILYAGLTWGGARRRQHWAWSAVLASAVVGFLSFFLFLGFGYFDPLHALVSVLLLPLFLLGAWWGQPRGTADYGPPGLGLRNDRAWWLGVFGQLCFILLGVGLAVGAIAIAVTGITQVFVPTDLAFMRVEGPFLREISPRLVPLVAHDRAGFGGALFCNAVALLLAALWGFRPDSRWLWWTLLLAGLPGFGATIGIHYVVGYTDPLHIAPVWLAALLYLLGLGFTYRFTAPEVQTTAPVRSVSDGERPQSLSLGDLAER